MLGIKMKPHKSSSFINIFRRCRDKCKDIKGERSINQSKSSNDVTEEFLYHLDRTQEVGNAATNDEEQSDDKLEARDFMTSIEKVKDCGWYWGPLGSLDAEKLLKGEPDGSFLVRDSSDVRHFFSLTFKMDGNIRHVRIEHDQGNFSFGPSNQFKSSTIVEFIENAIAHSRSGRYLFFLHRRPRLGPMQVQLLHPCSRFRAPRSLKHMCRFEILKHVRRDLIVQLPLPVALRNYLNAPNHYYENVI